MSPPSSSPAREASFPPALVPTIATPFPWRVGEHIAVSGQTGSGKSTLMSHLLGLRRFVLVLRTKPDTVTYEGARVIRKAKTMDDPRHERVVLAPAYRDQQEEVALALERVWTQGGWTVYIDETFYVFEQLRLGPFVERLLTQGRSKRISVICAMQRPVRVTRFAISEASHVIAFYLEGRDRKIMQDAAGESLADIGGRLERYQFGWYYRPTRETWVGRFQDLIRG